MTNTQIAETFTQQPNLFTQKKRVKPDQQHLEFGEKGDFYLFDCSVLVRKVCTSANVTQKGIFPRHRNKVHMMPPALQLQKAKTF